VKKARRDSGNRKSQLYFDIGKSIETPMRDILRSYKERSHGSLA
jgi:hypothetical protein